MIKFIDFYTELIFILTYVHITQDLNDNHNK